MENLQGKTAFITGAASGIGLGIAKAFAKHGMNIVIADARSEAVENALSFFKDNGYPAHGIALNVTDRDAYARAADEAESVFGNIHILVNNAGVAAGMCPIQEASFNDWDFIVSVNITGVFNGIATILPRILRHGEPGHVVSTSSTGGAFAVAGAGLYCTTKFAVSGMMESLASDLAETNVGVSVFYPGPINSNLGASTETVRPDSLKNDQPEQPQPPPSPFNMDAVEAGERVVRAIKRGDLFIWTHPEFKAGMELRNKAIIKAFPDEPIDEMRLKELKTFGTLVYNPVYEKQTTPPALQKE